MQRILPAAGLALLLASCSGAADVAQCPDPAAVAPASIGASYVAGLSQQLAGPDRENSITVAIADLHRRDPKLDSTAITNILIAADCAVVSAKPDHDDATDRARVSGFRAQVDQLLGQ